MSIRVARFVTLGALLIVGADRAAGQIAAEAGSGTEPRPATGEMPPAAGEAGATAAASRVIARVNGEPLYAEDLESVLGEIHRSPEAGERAEFDLDRLIFRLVNDTLLAQEARSLGLDERPELVRKLAARREEIAQARLYREEILEKLELEEPAVRAVYDDLFRTATLRIVTRRDRAELERLRSRVAAATTGEAFAALAHAESEDSYRGRGGLIDRAPLADLLLAVRDFAARARLGELSPPLETSWGVSLVRLELLEPADPDGYAKKRHLAFFELRRRQEEALRAALVARIGSQLEVAVDDAAFAAVGCRRMHDGRLLPEFADAERVVARVGERTVTTAELAGKLATAWSGLANVEMATSLAPAVLDQLVFDRLLAVEALRRGYGDTSAVERELHALETRQLATRFLKEVMATEMEIDEAEQRAFYQAHREEFRRPPRLHVLQLTVATEAEAARLAEQARGGADFAWIVRRHSIDAYREAGGDRGWMPANRALPLFARELAGAAAGEIFGPRGLDGQWIVVQVDLVEDQGVYEFDEVSGNVRGRIVDERIAARIDGAIRRLRDRSEIWIDEAAVAAMRIAPAPHEGGPAVPGHSGS